jgi:hypothetical protein
LDGVNVVVVVTDERSEAVGVTIVEQDEVIDGYFVFDRELHNGRLSFVVIIESDDGGINFDDSLIDRVSSSLAFPLIVE